MSNLDVRIGWAILLDTIQEITVMSKTVGLPGHRLAQFIARAVQLKSSSFAQDQNTFGAVKGVAVFMTFLGVRRPEPLFVNELFPWFGVVFEQDILSVWKLLIV